MSEEYPSSVKEFIRFMKWILNADPISSLQIAAVRGMSPSMRYIIMRGIDYLNAFQHAFQECKTKDLQNECVKKVVEKRTGVDYETALNGIKNLSTVATILRSLSKNAQNLVAHAVRYILLGMRHEVRYNIGGWLSGSEGFDITRFRSRRSEEEEE